MSQRVQCAQCRLSNQKKKCTPVIRQWPDLCDYCLKKGFPCSEFMTPKEFKSLSVTELATLHVKSQWRPPKDIISDLDCLFYLQNELGSVPRSSQAPPYGVETYFMFCHVQEAATYATNRILKTLVKIKQEAEETIKQLIRQGDGEQAYLLDSLCSGRINYSQESIREEYAASRLIDQASFDKSCGLLFRMLRGLETIPGDMNFVRSRPTTIYQTDITHLYRTLKRVASFCSIYSGRSRHCEHCKEKQCVMENIFETVSPLFFKAICLSERYATSLNDWLRIGFHHDIVDSMAYNGDTALHFAIYCGDWATVDRVLHAIESSGRFGILQTKSLDGHTPLQLAVLIGDPQTVLVLVNYYEKINMPDPLGRPVHKKHLAHAYKHSDILSQIPVTPFMLAIICGHQTIINFFSCADQRWLQPSSAFLTSVFSIDVIKDLNLEAMCLGPIHVAGITENYDLFKLLVDRQKQDPEVMRTVALIAAIKDNEELILLFKYMDLPEREVRNLHIFIEWHGSQKVLAAFLSYFHVAINLNNLLLGMGHYLESSLLIGSALQLKDTDMLLDASEPLNLPIELSLNESLDGNGELMEGMLDQPHYQASIPQTPARLWFLEGTPTLEDVSTMSSQNGSKQRSQGPKSYATYVTRTSKTSSSAKSISTLGGFTFLRQSNRLGGRGAINEVSEEDTMEVDQEETQEAPADAHVDGIGRVQFSLPKDISISEGASAVQ